MHIQNTQVGERLVEDARAALAQCTLTFLKYEPFAAKLHQFHTHMLSLKSSAKSLLFVFTPEGESLLIALKSLTSSATNDFRDCLPSHKPNKNMPAVRQACDAWLDIVWQAHVKLLKSILIRTATKDDLHQWHQGVLEKAPGHSEVAEATLAAGMLCGDTMEMRNIERAHTAALWLCKVAAILCPGAAAAADRDALVRMQHEFRLCFQPFESASEEADLPHQDVLASPLLMPGGDYEKAIWNERLCSLGVEAVGPVTVDFKTVFGGELPLRGVPDRAHAAVLQLWSTAAVDQNNFARAMEWAQSTGDRLLMLQLQALDLVLKLGRAYAGLALASDAVLGAKLKERAVTSQHIEMISLLRTQHKLFNDFYSVALNETIFDDDQVILDNAQFMHVELFERCSDHPGGFLNIRNFFTDAERKVNEIEGVFGASWQRDISMLSKSIDTICPKWQLHRDSILSNPAIWQAFLDMPQKHTSGLGPMASQLSEQLDLMEKLSPLPVPAAEIMSAKRARDLGTETVVFGFVVRCVKHEWPKSDAASSVAEAREAIKQLRGQVIGHTLTQEMEDELKAWDKGERLRDAEPQGAPEPVPQSSKKGIEPASQSSKEPQKERPEAASQSSTPPTDAPAPSASPQPSASLSLAARALQAKRARQ